MKKLLLIAAATLALTVGSAFAATMPKTVIHVITIKWKEGTKPEQINAALMAAQTLGKEYKGIERVWTRAIKVQGSGYTHAIVMEFKDEAALKAYVDTPAQKKFYEVYMPIRGESTTHDITN